MNEKNKPKGYADGIPVHCAYDKLVKIEQIKANPQNPNQHSSDQIELLAKIIASQGWRAPITVSTLSGLVVRGHGRLMAAVQNQSSIVPVDYQHYKTHDEEMADLIADNRLSELSDMDNVKLANILKDLDQEVFTATAYSDNEVDDILKSIRIEAEKEVVEDEYDEDKYIEPEMKYGDMYKLGKHTLLCGDSNNSKDMLKLTGSDGFAELGFLDPPYDMKSFDWLDNLTFIKTGHPILLMASDKQTAKLVSQIQNFRQFLIHDRQQGVMVSNCTPISQHTIISLFCDHPSRYFVNHKDNFTSIIKCKKDYKKASSEMGTKMGKPVEIIGNLIKHYTSEGDSILDFFGGGGSTVIACEQLNRICYIIELDPSQCDVIISRWEEFTGERARKIIK